MMKLETRRSTNFGCSEGHCEFGDVGRKIESVSIGTRVQEVSEEWNGTGDAFKSIKYPSRVSFNAWLIKAGQ
jgi:hypothetical protein